MPAKESRYFQLILVLHGARLLLSDPAVLVKLAAARRVDLRILAGHPPRFRRRLAKLGLARLRGLQPRSFFLAPG